LPENKIIMRKRSANNSEKPIQTNPNQHQDYDKILKKKFSKIYQSLIHKLLGIDIKNAVKLPTSFSRTKEKRPDFVAKVSTVNETPYIVHVEFQARSDDNMDKRELGYYNDIYWEFDLEVMQYVIFLGSGKPNMKAEIKHKNLNFSYTIIVMNEIDVQFFLNSDNPHEIVLAILCKYDKKEAPLVIKKILAKLEQKAKNERELYEYTTDLEILSGLRKLQSETKKQIDKMPIIYDLRKDLRFKEGKRETTRAAVIRMLKDKTLSVEKIAHYVDVSIDYVKKIQEELKKNSNIA
jgi:predicted transposase YdaD